jgi:hypothetical protein
MLEYRLDDTANKYVSLFFENNSYDWLDGYSQRYGGGFIWRRSLSSLGDIFRFSSDQPAIPSSTLRRGENRDSLNTRRDSLNIPRSTLNNGRDTLNAQPSTLHE